MNHFKEFARGWLCRIRKRRLALTDLAMIAASPVSSLAFAANQDSVWGDPATTTNDGTCVRVDGRRNGKFACR